MCFQESSYFRLKSEKECLDFIQHHNPDLIILDIKSPLGSKEDITAQTIKAIRKYSVVPIIGISSINSNTFSSAAYEAGLDILMIKPLRQFELLARVRSLLRQRATFDLKKRVQTKTEILVGSE